MGPGSVRGGVRPSRKKGGGAKGPIFGTYSFGTVLGSKLLDANG